MTTFIEQQWLKTETCPNCSMLFAVPQDFNRRRREDGKNFYCPAGHAQHYKPGNSDTDKLRREVEREKQMREAAEGRAGKAEQNLAQVARAHRKMRERVMNGVCPCCNRSFGNLREHMKTEHPEFGKERTLFALRQAFGMSQAAVAAEAGVNHVHVSGYERGHKIAPYARGAIEAWMSRQDATSAA